MKIILELNGWRKEENSNIIAHNGGMFEGIFYEPIPTFSSVRNALDKIAKQEIITLQFYHLGKYLDDKPIYEAMFRR